MPRYLIIDGYNAIHKIDEFEAKKDISLETARMAFIMCIRDFLAQKSRFYKVSIVFDSKEEFLGIRKSSYGKVEAIFATNDRDADNVIVDLLRKAAPKDKITVCSDDNFVRNHARSFGRDVMSVAELRNIILLKKKTVRSKIHKEEITCDKLYKINNELKKHWGIE